MRTQTQKQREIADGDRQHGRMPFDNATWYERLHD